MGDHGCDQTCVNTPGSYYCNCEHGFQLINNTECDGKDLVMIKHGKVWNSNVRIDFEVLRFKTQAT